MKNFSVEAVVACEDIRREITNKDILIGVYADGVNVFEIPGLIALAFWVQLNCLKDMESADLYLHAQTPDGTEGPTGRFQMKGNIKAGTSFALIVPPMPYNITKVGDIKVKIKENEDGKWHDIKKLRIENRPIEDYKTNA